MATPDESTARPALHILQQAVENTNEAFVTIDESHRVVFFNKAAERLFSVSRLEILGQDLNLILGPGCSQDHRLAVQRYLETGVGRLLGHETEMTVWRRSGETFPASISFSETWADGRRFFTAIIRDLSETQALRNRVAQAERLAGLGQFVAEITHEIKNPLTLIGGFARQLQKVMSPGDSLAKLQVISREVERLERLLAELRESYRPMALEPGPVDVNILLAEIVALLTADCGSNRIRVELTTDPACLPVAGDPRRLEQVFLNLAKNAVEAMVNGGRLQLATRFLGDAVEATVADEGCGIAADLRDKVFTPFYTTKKGGTGLGLGIARQIVEAHPGSSFSMESQEGQGTTFRIRLPVFRPAAR
ncbi:MAG: ATP-binding protein [Thermodesulfobacteriota bacterium]